jgi:hypothetical protein
MAEVHELRGAVLRAVGEESHVRLGPALDALLGHLKRAQPEDFIRVRPGDADAIVIRPAELLKPVLQRIDDSAVHAFQYRDPPFATDNVRFGPLRSDRQDPKRLQDLRDKISAIVDAALASVGPEEVVMSPRDADAIAHFLEHEGGSLPEVFVDGAGAELVEFELRPRPSQATRAVLLSSAEEIDRRQIFNQVVGAVRAWRTSAGVAKPNVPEPDFSTQFDNPGSQLNRFLDFLVVSGLARVHAEVGLDLLATVASANGPPSQRESASLLARYCDAIRLTRTVLAQRASLQLPFGACDLGAYARTNHFISRLPIAIVHHEQQFEFSDPARIVREVTYRLRVNGTRPAAALRGRGETPLEALCERVTRGVADGESAPYERGRLLGHIAQLLLTWLVLPRSETPTRDSVLAAYGHLRRDLEADPEGTLSQVIDEVRAARQTFDHMRTVLVGRLRNTPGVLRDAFADAERQVHLLVAPAIFNDVGGRSDPLLERFPGEMPAETKADEKNAREQFWFTQLRTAWDALPARDGGTPLFHVATVRCRRRLRVLDAVGKPRGLTVRRAVPGAILNVVLVEHAAGDDRSRWAPVALPRRVVVALDPGFCALRPVSQAQGHAVADVNARVMALRWALLAIVTQTTLRALLRQLRKGLGEPLAQMLLMRVHERDGKLNPEKLRFTTDEVLKCLGAALEQCLATTPNVRAITNQGVILRARGPASLTMSADDRRRMRAAKWAITSRWPLVMDAPFGTWAVGPDQSVGIVCLRDRPIHDGRGRTLLIGESLVARSAGDGRLTMTAGPRIAEVLDGDPQERAATILRELRDRMASEGCGLVLLLLARYGGRHVGRSEDPRRIESSSLLDAIRVGEGGGPRLCPIAYGTASAVRLQENRASAARVYVLPRARDHESPQLQLQGASDAMEYVPFLSVATLKIVGRDFGGRPQSGLTTYYLTLVPGDAEERAQLQNAVLVPEQPWHGRVRDALLAAHFYVTEKEVADPETTAIEQGGFLAVLSPHDPITVEELSDVGEFHVPGSRRKPALMSLLALLADANSLMRGTT